MLKTRKTTAKKRANRSLAMLREMYKNQDSFQKNGNDSPSPSPFRPVQLSQLSSQGFAPNYLSGNSTGSPGSEQGRNGMEFGKEDLGMNSPVRISGFPKFVDSADSLVAIKGETSGRRNRLLNMCSSEPAVRGFSYFASPQTPGRGTSGTSSVNANGAGGDNGRTSRYFGTPVPNQNTGRGWTPSTVGRGGGGKGWSVFRKPLPAYQTPWITRSGMGERSEMEGDEENRGEVVSESTVKDMIDSLMGFEGEEGMDMGPFF